MEDKNIIESIKIKKEDKININELHEKSITHMLDKYELMRFENILKEINAVRDILGMCGEADKETMIKYSQLLKKLIEEKITVEQNLKQRETEENMEK